MGLKILHSADWHLDSPFGGFTQAQRKLLIQEQRKIPGKIADLCCREECDMVLLAGDLFDGEASWETLAVLKKALADCGVPVLIAPGNHDYCAPGSPWLEESWPENVHVFTGGLESVVIGALDCRVYGAGYQSMDCPGLLEGFRAQGGERYQVAVLHGDPSLAKSPSCPITTAQVRDSHLHYLALGHIHKAGAFQAGRTLCAWPGCPMGRGYDEPGIKGVWVVTLDETVSAEFLALNTPRFFDETAEAGEEPLEAVSALLPPIETQDAYRITLTGYSAPIDLDAIASQFAHITYLELRDRTLPEVDLWSAIGEDTLEGVYFKILHDGLETDSEKLQRQLKLAARISRQILDGQEVVLP